MKAVVHVNYSLFDNWLNKNRYLLYAQLHYVCSNVFNICICLHKVETFMYLYIDNNKYI